MNGCLALQILITPVKSGEWTIIKEGTEKVSEDTKKNTENFGE